MSRRLLFATLFICLGATLWAFGLPGSVPKPTAEVRRFELEAISFRDVTFLFELAVKNPYPVNLGFDGMTLGFTVEGAKVFTAASKGGFSVPANSEKSNTFTVTLAYDAIIKLVKDYTTKDWLNTVVDGTLVIPLPKLPGLPGDHHLQLLLLEEDTGNQAEAGDSGLQGPAADTGTGGGCNCAGRQEDGPG